MGAKRVKSANSIEKGERGLAMLNKLDATRARLDFIDTGATYNVNVDQTGERPTLPSHVPFGAMKVGSAIQISATMAKDEPTVLFANPASGQFKVKFVQFVSPENQPPVPETRQGKKAGSTYRVFSMLMDIQEGRWKGGRLWAQLYANFGNSDGELAVSGAGTGSDNLQDFLDASTGNEWTVLKFSENPLPEIQKLAQDLGKTFEVMIVKGWVDKFIPEFGSDDAFEDQEYPEEVVPSNVDEIHDALKDE